jgi:hypothetical protein
MKKYAKSHLTIIFNFNILTDFKRLNRIVGYNRLKSVKTHFSDLHLSIVENEIELKKLFKS